MAANNFNRCAITFAHGSYFQIVRTAYYYNSTSQDSDAHNDLANLKILKYIKGRPANSREATQLLHHPGRRVPY